MNKRDKLYGISMFLHFKKKNQGEIGSLVVELMQFLLVEGAITERVIVEGVRCAAIWGTHSV